MLYARVSADPGWPAGLGALARPSGQRPGVFSDLRRQGGGFAIPLGRQRGYVLDRPFFHAVELPSLKPVRSLQIDEAASTLGDGRVLTVSADGAPRYT